jgi:hypothetical protein
MHSYRAPSYTIANHLFDSHGYVHFSIHCVYRDEHLLDLTFLSDTSYEHLLQTDVIAVHQSYIHDISNKIVSFDFPLFESFMIICL